MRGERVEIDCLVRFLFVPKAMRKNIPAKDFFYRLTSPVSPPHEEGTGMGDVMVVGRI